MPPTSTLHSEGLASVTGQVPTQRKLLKGLAVGLLWKQEGSGSIRQIPS